MEKVALFVEKDRDKEKTFNEHYKKFKKEIEDLSHLEEEATKPKKKRKVTMRKKGLLAQFERRRAEKAKRMHQEDEGEVGEESESEGPLSAS